MDCEDAGGGPPVPPHPHPLLDARVEERAFGTVHRYEAHVLGAFAGSLSGWSAHAPRSRRAARRLELAAPRSRRPRAPATAPPPRGLVRAGAAAAAPRSARSGRWRSAATTPPGAPTPPRPRPGVASAT